jgi:hypothetical protein
MSLYNQIIEAFPELAIDDNKDEFGLRGLIELRDDGDGIAYVAVWNYSKPIPDGLKVGK